MRRKHNIIEPDELPESLFSREYISVTYAEMRKDPLMTTPTLVTDRLMLRPLQVDDAVALHAMFHDPIAMRYWHELPHLDIATTREDIMTMLNPHACWWAICERGEEQSIGIIGYLDTTMPIPGMGYFLHPAFWRKGMMTEAGRVVLEYGFTQLGLDRVELWIHEENTASQRLAHKLGFARRGHFPQWRSPDSAPHQTLVFGLYHWEWEADQPSKHRDTPRFDSVKPILAVADVTAALHFYREQLGFTVVWASSDTPEYAIVAHREWMATGVCFHLNHVPEAIANTSIILLIDVSSDIDALYASYVAKGITIAEPIITRPWGSREFDIVDIDGYRLRFTAPFEG